MTSHGLNVSNKQQVPFLHVRRFHSALIYSDIFNLSGDNKKSINEFKSVLERTRGRNQVDINIKSLVREDRLQNLQSRLQNLCIYQTALDKSTDSPLICVLTPRLCTPHSLWFSFAYACVGVLVASIRWRLVNLSLLVWEEHSCFWLWGLHKRSWPQVFGVGLCAVGLCMRVRRC